VAGGASVVLIDPLPLAPKALESLSRLGRVVAICLTGSCHQRSGWRYRGLFGARLLAPRASQRLEAEPDGFYDVGDRLPGGLRAIHTPGPTESHFALHGPAAGGVLFCADVLVHLERSGLRFVPDVHQDEPARTRVSAKGLLELDFKVLCPAHGAPVTADAKRAVRGALKKDAAR
jgi:glyoxylase-like metal-dependent hydrolase (beta-lactamase superfamily II)